MCLVTRSNPERRMRSVLRVASDDELTALFCAYSEIPIMTTSDREAMIERIIARLESEGEEAVLGSAGGFTSRSVVVSQYGRISVVRRLAEFRDVSAPEWKYEIRLLVSENPKHAAAAKRFDVYENGMTCLRYARELVRRGLARRQVTGTLDLVYDARRGFIEIRDPETGDIFSPNRKKPRYPAYRRADSQDAS